MGYWVAAVRFSPSGIVLQHAMGVNFLDLLPDRGWNLAAVTNQFVGGELRGDASDGSQNLRIWQGQDTPAGRRQHRASYEAKSATWLRLAPSSSWASTKGTVVCPWVNRRPTVGRIWVSIRLRRL